MRYNVFTVLASVIVGFVIGALVVTQWVQAENGLTSEGIGQKLDEVLKNQSEIAKRLELLDEVLKNQSQIFKEFEYMKKELYQIKIKATLRG